MMMRCECGQVAVFIQDAVYICKSCRETVEYKRKEFISHWPALHQYPVDHADDWSTGAAKAFYSQWDSEIPSYGCSCESNWRDYTAKHPPVFTSPKEFFEWSIEAHNHVSTHHATPRKLPMSQREAEGLYQAPWITRQPRGMITFAVGDHLPVLDITLPAMRAYARRVGAELIVITDDLRPDWTMANKWRASSYAWHFDRLLWVDSDIVIKPDAPDIFDTYPSGFGICDEKKNYYQRETWYETEVAQLLASQGIAHELNVFPNSGVMLYGPEDIDLYREPPKPYPMHWCAEQHWSSYQLDTHRERLTLMDDRWNWGYIGPHWWSGLDAAYFIHLNGCKPLDHRLELARRLIAGDYSRIEEPQNEWRPPRLS